MSRNIDIGTVQRADVSPIFWASLALASILGALVAGFVGGILGGMFALAGFIPGFLGGAVGGSIAVGIQRLALRPVLSRIGRWFYMGIVVIALAWGIEAAFSAYLVNRSNAWEVEAGNIGAWLAIGIVVGALAGSITSIFQRRLLQQQINGPSSLWLLVHVVAWAIGGVVFLSVFWSLPIIWVGGGNPGPSAEAAIDRNLNVCLPACLAMPMVALSWSVLRIYQKSRKTNLTEDK